MKKIDFSKTGGFPLTQDRLGYMQAGYTEALTALANGGSNVAPGANIPMALYGMTIDISNNMSDGWLIYNGEIMPFTGGSLNFSVGGKSKYITISQTTQSLTFGDGNSKAVISEKTASLTDVDNGTPADATQCPYTSLLYKGNAGAYTSIVSTGNTDGTASWDLNIAYRYDLYRQVIHMKGSVLFTAGFPQTGNDVQIVKVFNMLHPITIETTGFSAYVRIGSEVGTQGVLPDPSGNSNITSIDGYVAYNGEVRLMLKPSLGYLGATYPVYMNCLIPIF